MHTSKYQILQTYGHNIWQSRINLLSGMIFLFFQSFFSLNKLYFFKLVIQVKYLCFNRNKTDGK